MVQNKTELIMIPKQTGVDVVARKLSQGQDRFRKGVKMWAKLRPSDVSLARVVVRVYN